MTTPKFLRRDKASQFLTDDLGYPCARTTLAKLAVIGGGPPFHKAGRIPLYERADLEIWASNKIGPLLLSTSERSRRVA